MCVKRWEKQQKKNRKHCASFYTNSNKNRIQTRNVHLRNPLPASCQEWAWALLRVEWRVEFGIPSENSSDTQWTMGWTLSGIISDPAAHKRSPSVVPSRSVRNSILKNQEIAKWKWCRVWSFSWASPSWPPWPARVCNLPDLPHFQSQQILAFLGYAIKCYQCDSITNPKCGEKFEKDSSYLLDCSKIAPPRFLQSFFPVRNATGCLKKVLDTGKFDQDRDLIAVNRSPTHTRPQSTVGQLTWLILISHEATRRGLEIITRRSRAQDISKNNFHYVFPLWIFTFWVEEKVFWYRSKAKNKILSKRCFKDFEKNSK